jgi:hypothetical protein
MIAAGTHRTVWYSADGMHDSRFNASWPTIAERVVPLAGVRGGGFLFDTNALHVGSAVGDVPRSVVVVELDRHSRCADFAAIASSGAGSAQFRAPCPSGGQHLFSASQPTRSPDGGGPTQPGLLPCV